MRLIEETLRRVAAIGNLTVSRDVPLSRYTRFGIGGPADALVESNSAESFASAIRAVREAGVPVAVIGGGTNLVVSDRGFRGIVLRYTNAGIEADGLRVGVAAGAELQALVDFTIREGLGGIETMTGIPGSVGAAIYGNAGAYGRSISEFVTEVRFFDGEFIRSIDNAACQFLYRESVFKRHKDWIILAAGLRLNAADSAGLRRAADEIREVRDRKYPSSMRCAGSIFKNLIVADLPDSVAAGIPAAVVREGKAPSAYFLEQVGAKGLCRGDIRVADYHANLIYNDGVGSAADLLALILELKDRVKRQFGLDLEEEVQYVGF